MIVIHFITLCLFQAIIEFFPLSSSGHIILISKLLNIENSENIIHLLHIATALSIIVFFRKLLIQKKALILIFVSSIPLPIALVLKETLTLEADYNSLASGWLITSIFLFMLSTHIRHRQRTKTTLNDIDIMTCLLIGIAQAFCVFPGISRLGITTTIAVLRGFSLKFAIVFSFLISIIPQLGNIIFIDWQKFYTQLPPSLLIIGFIFTFSFSIIILYISIRVSIKIWRGFFFYCILLALFTFNLQDNQSKSRLYTMGTFLDISLWTNSNKKNTQVLQEIQRLTENVNKTLSTYIPNSDINNFNALNSNKAQKINKIFLDNIKNARDAWRLTNGEFDITIHPLIQLWENKLKKEIIPNQKEINHILKISSFQHLNINEKNKTLSKKFPLVKINFNGIAKGYVVDEIVKILKKNNISLCFINFGGSSLYYYSKNPHTEPYNIAIQDSKNLNKTITNIKLNNLALSTSGDYNNSTILNNINYNHIYNIKTGKPTKHSSTCSVITHNSSLSDALSTYFSIIKQEDLKKEFTRLKKIIPYLQVFISYKNGDNSFLR